MVDPLGVLVSLKKESARQKRLLLRENTPQTRPRASSSAPLKASGQVKTLIFLGFLFGLAGLIFYGSGRHRPRMLIRNRRSSFLFGVYVVFFTALAQLWINHPQTFAKNSRVVLMFGTLLAQSDVIMKVLMVFIGNGTLDRTRRRTALPVCARAVGNLGFAGQKPGHLRGDFRQSCGGRLSSSVDGRDLPRHELASAGSWPCSSRSRFVSAASSCARAFYVGLVTWLLAVSFGMIAVYTIALRPETDWSLFSYQSDGGRRHRIW